MQDFVNIRKKTSTPKSTSSIVTPSSIPQTALVLLLGPAERTQPPKALLETNAGYCIIDVNTVREMVDLRDEDIAVAVLSADLHRQTLRSAATLVRRQWPAAKILLDGRAKPDLDDHLYETAEDSTINPVGFINAVARMSGRRYIAHTNVGRKSAVLGEPIRALQPRSNGGLREGMRLIRSPKAGAWGKLMGLPQV